MQFSAFSDEHFMQIALQEAQLAYKKGEIPVGAVVVCKNRLVAKAHNLTEALQDPTAHAEILAITAACGYLNSKYLNNCTLYVTLEPCLMCAGSLFWSQIERLVYGADDLKRGYSRINQNILHPKTVVTSNINHVECKSLLDMFFKDLRN